MLTSEPTRATATQPSLQRNSAADSVRRAFELLGRASDDWRGNGAASVGSLHWPVAIYLARCALRQALEALEECP